MQSWILQLLIAIITSFFTGNRFALMETKLVLVHMLSQFNLIPVNKTPKTIKIVQKGFNMSIAGGFWMGLESRKS